MKMPLDACIYENLDGFITKKRTYVALAAGGVELLTQAAASLQNVR